MSHDRKTENRFSRDSIHEFPTVRNVGLNAYNETPECRKQAGRQMKHHGSTSKSHSIDKNEQRKMSRCVALRPVMNRISLLNLIVASFRSRITRKINLIKLPIDMIEMKASPWIFIQNQNEY